MARYRHIDMSPRLLPVDLQAQLVPGSFAHAVHHLVDQLDLSAFDAHYRNDDSGAPAHAPTMLLKEPAASDAVGIAEVRDRAGVRAALHPYGFPIARRPGFPGLASVKLVARRHPRAG